MNNLEMIQLLNGEISKRGYSELEKVLDNILLSCPRYAAQVVSPQEFAREIVKVLDGLSFKKLKQFVDNDEEAKRAHKIALQAIKIRKSIFGSNIESFLIRVVKDE